MTKLQNIILLVCVFTVFVSSTMGATNYEIKASAATISIDSRRDTTGETSLETVLTAIGTTNKTNLVLTDSVNCSSTVTIPANILIETLGGMIVKTSSCTIAIAGVGLKDPLSTLPIFSGFTPGNIAFTGTSYPAQIATTIFNNTNASTRINLADLALLGKKAKIIANAGHLGEEVLIHENHSLYLGIGTFTNSVAGSHSMSYATAFTLYSNTVVKGAGIGLTIVKETTSQYSNDIGIFYGSEAKVSGTYGANENITVSDLTILGEPTQPVNQNRSAIFLGNVTNGRIERNHIKGTHGFAAYVGGNGNQGNTARNCFIIDNIFENIQSQVAGAIIVDGLTISRNHFTGGGTIPTGYSYYIDLETNGYGILRNVIISDNIFEGTKTPAYYDSRNLNAIRINAGGADKSQNFVISGNQIKGIDLGANLNNAEGFFTGISLENVENVFITSNQITGTKQSGILAVNCASVTITNNVLTMVGRYYGIPAMILTALTNSNVSNNIFGLTRTNTNGENGQYNSFSKSIEERAISFPANVSGTTVSITDTTDVFEWWIGKTVNIATVTGVTGGDYTITSVNHSNRTFTINASAGMGATNVVTKFSNNIYKDNANADYSIGSGSASRVVDSSVKPQTQWSVFIPGELTYTGHVGIAYFPQTVKTLYYSYKPIRRGSGSTQAPVLRISVVDGNFPATVYSSQDVALNDVGGSDVGINYPGILNLTVPGSLMLRVEIITPAIGASVTKDVNFTIGYTQ